MSQCLVSQDQYIHSLGLIVAEDLVIVPLLEGNFEIVIRKSPGDRYDFGILMSLH